MELSIGQQQRVHEATSNSIQPTSSKGTNGRSRQKVRSPPGARGAYEPQKTSALGEQCARAPCSRCRKSTSEHVAVPASAGCEPRQVHPRYRPRDASSASACNACRNISCAFAWLHSPTHVIRQQRLRPASEKGAGAEPRQTSRRAPYACASNEPQRAAALAEPRERTPGTRPRESTWEQVAIGSVLGC